MDIHDEDICTDVEYFSEFLWAELQFEIKKRNLEDSIDPNQVHLVLEPRVDYDGVLCCYYFVNPAGRSLFWLDDWDNASGLLGACRDVDSLSHKGKPHVWLSER